MPTHMTSDQLEHMVAQLPPYDQLKLVAHICEQLSTAPPDTPISHAEKKQQRQREKDADEILALCDAAAEQWDRGFDSTEEICQMRRNRDEEICPSKL